MHGQIINLIRSECMVLVLHVGGSGIDPIGQRAVHVLRLEIRSVE